MKERFAEFKGYKFDKLLFRGMLILLVLIVFALLLTQDNYFRFECSRDSPGFCETNDFKSLCQESFLNKLRYGDLASRLEVAGLCSGNPVMPGFKFVYGSEPSRLVNAVSGWLFLLPIIAVLFNHFKYNRDYEVPKKKEEEK